MELSLELSLSWSQIARYNAVTTVRSGPLAVYFSGVFLWLLIFSSPWSAYAGSFGIPSARRLATVACIC